MATTLLLIIIYLAFLSLGLPDGLMGVAWPDMRQTFDIPLAGAGYLTVLGTIGATVSSFSSGHILKRIQTGQIVLISSLLTGIAILFYAFAQHFIILVLLSVPMGLGAGAVDAAMNNYVAKYFTSRHMNWLHAFWGIGAFGGPLIMTGAIVYGGSWRYGYFIVGALQLCLAFIFLVSLKLWTINETKMHSNKLTAQTNQIALEKTISSSLTLRKRFINFISEIFRRKGLLFAILTFFFYVGAEAVIGLWSATYFREARAVTISHSGLWVSFYYASITIGRIFVGFFVEHIGTRRAVVIGTIISVIGMLLLILPLDIYILMPISMILIGLGFAPMYPCVMQDTPKRFGLFAPYATGYQMGFSNIGYTGLPIVVALIAQNTTLKIIPLFAFGFLALFIIFSTFLSRVHATPQPSS